MLAPEKVLLSARRVDEAALAVVGQVVRQVSDERQRVAKVPEVEKRLVVVAWVPVAFRKVKFCRVEEPVSRRFERVVRPPVAVRVPVKLEALEMV